MNKKINVDLVRSMLHTKKIGSKLLYFDSVDSTMDTIRGLPKKMAKEGTVNAISFNRAAFSNKFFAAVSNPGAIAPPIKAPCSSTMS